MFPSLCFEAIHVLHMTVPGAPHAVYGGLHFGYSTSRLTNLGGELLDAIILKANSQQWSIQKIQPLNRKFNLQENSTTNNVQYRKFNRSTENSTFKKIQTPTMVNARKFNRCTRVHPTHKYGLLTYREKTKRWWQADNWPVFWKKLTN